jgi:hypothetical protein
MAMSSVFALVVLASGVSGVEVDSDKHIVTPVFTQINPLYLSKRRKCDKSSKKATFEKYISINLKISLLIYSKSISYFNIGCLKFRL